MTSDVAIAALGGAWIALVAIVRVLWSLAGRVARLEGRAGIGNGAPKSDR